MYVESLCYEKGRYYTVDYCVPRGAGVRDTFINT